jgi:Transposase domain (DUF772)
MAFRAHDSQPDLLDSYLASTPKREVLRELKTMIKWSRLRTLVRLANKQGGPGQPGKDPVVLIKLLLLERLYALSDVQVVEEAADRLSFRQSRASGDSAAIAVNHSGVGALRAHAAHRQGSATYRNELAFDGGDDWGDAPTPYYYMMSATPDPAAVYHPDVTYRFTGSECTIRGQERGSISEVTTNLEVLGDASSGNGDDFFAHITTNGENVTDIFAVYAEPDGDTDHVTLMAVDP